ncbi:substrate-binding domain-containing protein [Gluconobacter oxydans]|uniref:Ribose ABC transporter, periplasmic binding protein n=5 Tax=Gluconobacter oxydans TaxID=442 RepID=Q5FNU3_GLUOX|nr:substrate-binding domain-containing protein [Gluconobacter oxydans]AAW61954.1 Ribose ABC transporter, periplasmic binding protein [Gluconobacter oxydans 621H]KXV10499.1 sugar ABC transporter substrate-binding protein [Gluconobacter oxydans]KXV34339.1 sugar ABC transporter substrate-binding protein [Gluconobacter oxydans]TCW21968.1 monosaccharide ABC transporter substrate-binding protein (CUT2 family) [Gluconobacter oxydans]GEC61853.1 ribose ABC transporter substrate-binding protein [Glucono
MKTAFAFAAMLTAAPFLAPLAAGQAHAADNSAPLRFVLIPKTVHPWFDKANNGAQAAATMISQATGRKVEIEYRAPQTADVSSQNDIIERAIATHPDGLILDLLDEKGNRATMDEAVDEKIPMTVFDSLPPEGMDITAVGADFCEQGTMAAERLANLVGKKGEVAIMMGVPTAPNHTLRAECEKKVFAKYPDMKVVATGVDNDSIETAQKQASAIMQAHPDLVGWVECDASGPVGVGQAIRESGKTGKVKEVGLDNLNDMIQLIKDGVAESSASSRPEMQGYWAVVSAWQRAMGQKTPKYIDTGIDLLTSKNL